jgi:two-component system heavy metal sensor histidine kinase CusS
MAEALSKINSRDLSQRLPTDLPVELEILGRTFNELLEKIESTLNKLSRFSADMAHEIRTPISNLRGEIEVALSRCRSANEYQEVLSSNLEECVRLKSIVDSLLFLARAESANSNLKRKELQLKEELANIAEFYEASAADADVKLRIDVPEMLTLRADHVLFQTAIGNLLSNAIRYTPKGGNITISALRQTSDVVVIKIADTGVGIPPEHLPFVFDRLYRVDQQRSSSGKENFGLGLSIVEAILRIHGGSASIESCVGQGTVVSLQFPANTSSSA